MRKILIENNYKYVYHFKPNGNIIQADFYRRKFAGLINLHEGKYEFHYDGEMLQSQRNYIDNIGLTEAVNYFYDDARLIRKEYYNDKMALRYTIRFEYKENGEPVLMEVKRFNGMLTAVSKNSGLINDYIGKLGREIDFLSEMLDFAEKINNS